MPKKYTDRENEYDRFTIKWGKEITDKSQLKQFIYNRWRKRRKYLQTALKEIQHRYNPPKGIRCIDCDTIMGMSEPIQYEKRYLYTYTCPQGHLPKRAFFESGQEYTVSTQRCTACFSLNVKTETREVDNQLIITDTCIECKHEHKPLSIELTELPILKKDRRKYCLTDEKAAKSDVPFWEKIGEEIERLCEILREIEGYPEKFK